MLLTSLFFAVAIGYLAWVGLSIFKRSVPVPLDASSFEPGGSAELAEKNGIYKNLQPLVLDLAAINRKFVSRDQLQKLNESLIASGDRIPWLPEEYIAVKQIEGLVAGLIVGGISLIQVSPVIALVIAIAVTGIYQSLAISGAHDKARSRLRTIKMRLPFVIDLMALMIEAGATFRDSLKTVVRENRDHPLGKELADIDRQIELGRSRSDALVSFRDKFDDQDVTELIFAINKGEELGTPLASTLRNQADLMRLKRSQWGEKAAAEAQVKMTFPGLLVMMACILVVLAPIILPAFSALLG